MNKMLVVIFDSDAAAYAGVRALNDLHDEGSLTMYGVAVIAKDAKGAVTVKDSAAAFPVGTGVGMAVGGLVGLLGGPPGVAVGAATGTLLGAVRDYWVAGVGLDFVEATERDLQPGKLAVIAEVDEDWVTPVDARMEAAGGVVFRRQRADFAQAQVNKDIATFKSEMSELEDELHQATGSARDRLQAKIAVATGNLETARQRAKTRFDELEQEAKGKIDSLQQQLAKAGDAAKDRLVDRVKRLQSAIEHRHAKLRQAWGLAKAALAD